MTALSVIQDHCKLHGLNVPSSVVSTADYTVIQLLAVLNEVLDDMVVESKYQLITREAVFTATAAEDQGAMTTLAPNGYEWAYNETFFDRTLKRPLYGPLDEVEWQRIKALPNPGPFYKFRIRAGHLLINPAPTTPLSVIAFEYASNQSVVSSTGIAKQYVTEDADTFGFPERILKKALAARWKNIKGLPYQEDQAAYYKLLNNYIARDKSKARINVAHPEPADIRPGVFVPSGNWNV